MRIPVRSHHLVLALFLALSCRAPVAGPWPPLSDSAFASLVSSLSGQERYFDTDNLISNEASYLEVVDDLERYGVTGGAYLGVGPGQNFSYIAHIRPSVAFLIDIRRDNLLQHLWYKALFVDAPTRIEFLASLYGRPAPAPIEPWRSRSLDDLLQYVDSAPAVDPGLIVDRVVARAASFGVPLSAEDRRRIASIHRRFILAGLDLRFQTHGRAPRACYPTHRGLLRDGGAAVPPDSYLATESLYQVVRNLQRDNLIIPLVGDLAGPDALPGVADELTRRATPVSAFYTSNVEFYLYEDGVFTAYLRNLALLPRDSASVIIRSVFPRGRFGVCSFQSLQHMSDLLAGPDAAMAGYDRMVRDGALPLR